MCSRANVSCVLTCLACSHALRAYVLTCLACLRVYVPASLGYLSAFVL